MKTINHFLLIACLSAGLPILAAEPTPGAPTNEPPSAPATTIQASADQPPPAPTPAPETVTNTAATRAALAQAAGPRHQRSAAAASPPCRRWSSKTAPTDCA